MSNFTQGVYRAMPATSSETTARAEAAASAGGATPAVIRVLKEAALATPLAMIIKALRN